MCAMNKYPYNRSVAYLTCNQKAMVVEISQAARQKARQRAALRGFCISLAVLVIGLLGTLLVCAAFGQDTAVVGTNAAAAVSDGSGGSGGSSAPAWALDLALKYPWLATIVTIMGICRLCLKPLFTLFHTVAAATPTAWDDALLAKIEANKVFKWVAFALDYVGSIKLVNPATKP